MINERVEELQARFSCVSCGNCCRNGGDIFLDLEDANRIISYFDLEYVSFHSLPIKALDSEFTIFQMKKTKPCFFLDRITNLCNIYEIRPKACQDYPFKLLAKGGCNWQALGYCVQAFIAIQDYFDLHDKE